MLLRAVWHWSLFSKMHGMIWSWYWLGYYVNVHLKISFCISIWMSQGTGLASRTLFCHLVLWVCLLGCFGPLWFFMSHGLVHDWLFLRNVAESLGQGNLIQGKAWQALKNWKNLFGDQREDSSTSLKVCKLLKSKLLHITKLSSLWSPKLFSSYLILPLV